MNRTGFVTIRREHPATEHAAILIAELDAYLDPLYPKESQHGYSIDRLVEQQVEFFVLYHDEEPAGCGGVQFFGGHQNPEQRYGELKRMYVRSRFRGLGYGKRMLRHLENLALDRDTCTMRLETGTLQPEAIGLYEQCGYYRTPPFGNYWDDPVSLCYEKRLDCAAS